MQIKEAKTSRFRQIFRLISSISCALVIAIFASPTMAETIKDFATVQVVRNSSPSCEPTCPEWISIQGTIGPALPAVFQKVIGRLGGKKLPVVLASNGGNTDAAFKIGRLIRKHGLDTAVGWTTVDRCKGGKITCRPDFFKIGRVEFGGAKCLSACVFILASGTNRLSGRNSLVGIHQGSVMNYNKRSHEITETKNKKIAGRMIKEYHTLIKSYLEEMDVDPALEDKASTELDIYEVSVEQQKEWNLTTSSELYPRTANSDVCRDRPIPENCITR